MQCFYSCSLPRAQTINLTKLKKEWKDDTLKPGLGVETAYCGKRHDTVVNGTNSKNLTNLANSENGREARQKRRIGGRTRQRDDGGWAVRGATPSGRATLRIFRCVVTNC